MKAVYVFLGLTVILSSNPIVFAQISWSEYSQNPVLDVGAPGSWDDYTLDQLGILLDDSIYKLWYSASNGQQFAIGYAYSPDGLTWTKYELNPVFSVGPPGAWDDNGGKAPKVLFVDGLYRMWYRGCGDGEWHTEVGYAQSTNGTTWERHGIPVLTLGAPGSWESKKIWDLTVIYNEGVYKMWYTAQDDMGIPRIGYATSPNCTTWTKYSDNPVLNLGNSGWWDDAGVITSAVLRVGSVYEMWYGGYSTDTSGFGYATSLNGMEWVRFDTLAPVWPMHGEPGSWDAWSRWSGVILFESSHYSMWFNGAGQDSTGKIGYASSSVTGIQEDSNAKFTPSTFFFFQNFPNPFNPTTTLTFTLPLAGMAKLEVFDINACRVGVGLAPTRLYPPGTHHLLFDGSSLPSGIYLARLTAGDWSAVQKLVLLK